MLRPSSFQRLRAFRIWRAGALGEYPRPRNREPIRSGGQRLHRPHVVSVSVIVIIGDVAVVVVADLSRRVRERVPDRRATAILTDGAFDLIGGGSGAQRNPAGKAREAARPAAAPSPGRARDGAAVADAPRADAPTMESWRRVRRVSSPASDRRQRRWRTGAASRLLRTSYTNRNLSFAVACDDDHTKRDLADMLRTFGFLRK